MVSRRVWVGLVLVCIAGAALGGCQAQAPSQGRPGRGKLRPMVTLAEAYRELQSTLDTLRVSGAVKTSDGLLLPETIIVGIRSEICVESRRPGQRFWSLDFDTCFVFVSADTVDEYGEYAVDVPCIDADGNYEASYPFGDLRLVPKGPVSFLADSDAGWRHQETFTTSRNQRRDLILDLDTEIFFVINDPALLRTEPDRDSREIGRYDFGKGIAVVRFHRGWAQCLMGGKIGWMEMRCLGTEKEMRELAPFRTKPEAPAER